MKPVIAAATSKQIVATPVHMMASLVHAHLRLHYSYESVCMLCSIVVRSLEYCSFESELLCNQADSLHLLLSVFCVSAHIPSSLSRAHYDMITGVLTSLSELLEGASRSQTATAPNASPSMIT